ncbi:MAG: aldehyde dehydrogenase family protein [Armatimonadetes bacterium]|nr:aldehyde dehydrogenase family protein [Armatimonadota bacterium]
MLVNGVFLGGVCDQGTGKQLIRSPYDHSVVGTAAEGGWSECDAALHSAAQAFPAWSATPQQTRSDLVNRIADAIEARTPELAELMALEIGKPISVARGELERTAITFRLAANLKNEQENLDLSYDKRGPGFRATVRRAPIGVVLAISPFNWPFNLAAHKIGPALMAGNTVVVKGSSQASLCTLTLARIIHEAGCPHGVFNAVNVPGKLAEKMALDDRVAKVSFTGSPSVGWGLKQLLPHKKVTLELGGNAFVIVDSVGDAEKFASEMNAAAYGYAGQVCISAQHVLVRRELFAEVSGALASAAATVKATDPLSENSLCGPLISEDAARRVESWLLHATESGARVLAGGTRNGTLIDPTLVEVSDFGSMQAKGVALTCDEVFGPVLTVSPFNVFDEALNWIQASQFGIHTSVYTDDEELIEKAFDTLPVSGLIVNAPPTVRFDSMPYGGVRRSGFGREGVPYTWLEMSEPKVIVRRN